jgi:hypothetical protein
VSSSRIRANIARTEPSTVGCIAPYACYQHWATRSWRGAGTKRPPCRERPGQHASRLSARVSSPIAQPRAWPKQCRGHALGYPSVPNRTWHGGPDSPLRPPADRSRNSALAIATQYYSPRDIDARSSQPDVDVLLAHKRPMPLEKGMPPSVSVGVAVARARFARAGRPLPKLCSRRFAALRAAGGPTIRRHN